MHTTTQSQSPLTHITATQYAETRSTCLLRYRYNPASDGYRGGGSIWRTGTLPTVPPVMHLHTQYKAMSPGGRERLLAVYYFTATHTACLQYSNNPACDDNRVRSIRGSGTLPTVPHTMHLHTQYKSRWKGGVLAVYPCSCGAATPLHTFTRAWEM